MNGPPPSDAVAEQPKAEMLRLERRMYELDPSDPERAEVAAQYDAVCDELGVPSGDMD